MNIFEIKREVLDILSGDVDPETGEISFEDAKRLEQLDMERGQKVENVVMFYKRTAYSIEEAKTEIAKLKDYIDKQTKRMENAQKYLDYALEGESKETPTYSVKYRTSMTTEVDDGFIKWAKRYRKDLIRVKPAPDPEPNKAAIAKAIKNGEIVNHAWLEPHTTMKIS